MMECCRREVQASHESMRRWIGGIESREGRNALRRFDDVLASGLECVMPDGSTFRKEELCAILDSLYGAESNNDLIVEIPSVRVKQLGGGMWLVIYEHWQRSAREPAWRKRAISGILREHTACENGLQWIHIHESGMLKGAPDSGSSEDADTSGRG